MKKISNAVLRIEEVLAGAMLILISVLVFFSAMCYIRKNLSTGYTVTILFFQITIQQILFREAFSL